MKKYYLNYLEELESEAIFILREVWAQFQNDASFCEKT